MGHEGKKPGTGLLSETTTRDDATDVSGGAENPYWEGDPELPPEPGSGCIRRGVCCRTSPGWFGPGEVERAAAVVDLTPDEFVRRYLVIDAIDVDDLGRVEVFAPVKLDRFGEPAFRPARRVDGWYRHLPGRCVFYEDNGCRIYEARPIECRAYLCSNADEDNLSHEQIARLWKEAEGSEDGR